MQKPATPRDSCSSLLVGAAALPRAPLLSEGKSLSLWEFKTQIFTRGLRTLLFLGYLIASFNQKGWNQNHVLATSLVVQWIGTCPKEVFQTQKPQTSKMCYWKSNQVWLLTAQKPILERQVWSKVFYSGGQQWERTVDSSLKANSSLTISGQELL